MIYLNQNLFSIDRHSVRENCNLFIRFQQRGKALTSTYQDFFDDAELDNKDFTKICYEVRREPYNYVVTDISDNKNININLRINWDWRFL